MKILLLTLFAFAISVEAVSVPKPKCDFECLDDYNPVCGGPKNGPLQTYPNECNFNLANCKARQQLEMVRKCACTEKTCPPKCNSVCSILGKPVCGGPLGGPFTTYRNKCEFDSANCESGNKFILYRNTTCPEGCPNTCPTDVKLVCGGPKGGPYRYFRNICQFTKDNCNWKYVFEIKPKIKCESVGERCARRCPNTFEPVCAERNGIVEKYRNKCELDVLNCRYHNTWKITDSPYCPLNCTDKCPEVYKPICAGPVEGPHITYYNLCALRHERCTSRRVLKIIQHGVCPKTIPCNISCPKKYDPVCGGEKGQLPQTYRNLCAFKAAKCRNKKLQLVSKSVCHPQCNKPCTKERKPVCAGPEGGPYKNYSNKCVFDIENCKSRNQLIILNESACPKQIDNCNRECLTIYKPVCGGPKGGPYKSYANKCVFDIENCKARNELVIFRNSACPISSSSSSLS